MSHQGVDDNTQADADFDSGFASELPPPLTVSNEANPKPETAPQAEAATVAAPTPKAPNYVQITKEDFDFLKTAATKTTDFEKQFSKAFGTMGALQQTVKKLQEATPLGMSIDLPSDAFSELEADYPELAAQLRAGLGKAMKNVRGTKLETGPADMPIKPSDQPNVSDLIKAAVIESETEALEDLHPDWRGTVGAVDAEGRYDPEHPFRKWLATKDEPYQQKINSTNRAAVIARAIDRFATETAAPGKPETPTAPKAAARRDRIESAVQPRGDGKPPSAQTKSADDEFDEGFRSG